MQKIASFIVRRRKGVMTVVMIITILCAILSTRVYINEDMTEYLPDDSSMKQGMNIMSDEFPETAETYSIRVMIQDLEDGQKQKVNSLLENLDYVDSVDYDSTEDHNKDDQTLYVVNTTYAYTSDEEKALENNIADALDGYTYIIKNNDTSLEAIPLHIMVAALAIMMAVLWIMCGSWIEPLLFLLVIGLAVIINAGTNYFLGSVSNITSMISALLQLVLSMDYSIILMNRYRQELKLNPNKTEAMATALAHAFPSITSSAVTTIVGLLALVFMSLKIGMDLGIVLAKGVLISMICVFTVLPGIILMSTKLIEKTAKKVPHFKMNRLGKLSYKLRVPVTIAFVLLFIGAYNMQNSTETAFTLADEDPIADVFPNTNTIVLVYDNEDDEAVSQMAEDLLDSDDKVNAAVSYSTMLGKAYTAEELADSLSSLSDELDLDPEMLKILYYDYFSHDDKVTMTAGEFLHFLADDVLTNEAFAAELDGEMTDKIDLMLEFADADKLTEKKSASQLAKIFDMDVDTIENLLLLYYTNHGGVKTGTMTLPVFAEFVTGEVLKDPNYSSMFDKNTQSMMNTLLTFTDASAMTAPRDYKGIASVLGIDEDTARLLFVYYYAMQDSYDPGSMTTAQFVDLIQNKVAQDPVLSSYLDDSAAAQISMLGAFCDKEGIQAQKTSAELSQLLGIDQALIEQIFTVAIPGDADNKTMSAVELVDFLVNNMSGALDKATLGKLQMIRNIMSGVLNDAAYTYKEMAAMIGMEESMVKVLYTFQNSLEDTSGWKLSAQTIVNFILKNKEQFSAVMGSKINQLNMLQGLINNSVAGTKYTYKSLAELLGIDDTQMRQLYLLYQTKHGNTSGWGISLNTFVTFIQNDILTNKNYSSQLDAEAAQLLGTARTLMDAVLSGKSYDAAGLTELFSGLSGDLDSSTMELLCLLYGSQNKYDSQWKMSVHQLFDHLTGSVLNDSRFEGIIDDEVRTAVMDNRSTIDDAIAQMKGENYSRLIISTTYSDESEETFKFIEGLMERCDAELSGDYHFIGSSVMNYELANNFDKEMLMITMITVLSVFLVVALTFRSLIIPLILVLLIQCGVFMTVTTIGLQGYSIYYLALLIVQSILMGATIDYGILYTNYYLENRRILDVKDALIAAYRGSVHTILTSGLILALVTGIVGNLFTNPTIGQICRTISIGAFCASLLVMFILPAILAFMDKVILRKKKKYK